MQISCPVELTAGHKPAWAKEGEDAWVRRVLGIPEEGQAFLLSLGECEATIEHEDTLKRIPLTQARIRALNAWLRVKFEQIGLFGAVIVITNQSRTSVLVQIKDDQHPNETCRGRMSNFGGTCQASEDPVEAAVRELYEEIRDPAVVDEIVAQLEPMGEFRLPSVQWPGDYACHMSVARAKSDEQFERWCEAIFAPDALSESNPGVLVALELTRALREERKSRGSRFVASHNQLIEIALGFVHG